MGLVNYYTYRMMINKVYKLDRNLEQNITS